MRAVVFVFVVFSTTTKKFPLKIFEGPEMYLMHWTNKFILAILKLKHLNSPLNQSSENDKLFGKRCSGGGEG